MVVYRQAEKNEFKKITELAKEVFKFDFEELLPKTFYAEGNVHEITKVAQREDGKLIAEVCVLPQEVTVGGEKLKSNYLGTVSVLEEHRGEGHMIKLMNICLDEMKGEYDLSVLGGRRQRYEYFGYTYGGVQWEYTINIHNIRHALKDTDSSGISFEPLFDKKENGEYAAEFNNIRKINTYREPELIEKILTSYHHTPYAVMENGVVIGYVLTTGENATISEIALNNYSNTKKVVKAFFEQFDITKVVVMMPEYESELQKEVSSFAECYNTIPCCMFNVFDFAKVIKAFLTVKNSYQKLSYGRFSAIMDNQPITVTVDENGISVEKTADSEAVVLSKMDAQKLILTPFGRHMNINVPADWFPLPVFWYYVDCF